MKEEIQYFVLAIKKACDGKSIQLHHFREHKIGGCPLLELVFRSEKTPWEWTESDMIDPRYVRQLNPALIVLQAESEWRRFEARLAQERARAAYGPSILESASDPLNLYPPSQNKD